MPPILFVVDRTEAGQTLAAVLKKRFGISWAQAKRLVENRHVRVGQQIETDVARRLKTGKKVELDAGSVEVRSAEPSARKPPAPPRPAGGKPARPAVGKPPLKTPPSAARDPKKSRPDRPLETDAAEIARGVEILYSDDAVVVVNKPAGLTTMRHAEEAAEFGARGKRFLPKTLADLLPGLLGEPNRPVRAVHRIDRDTSGLVVFARTPTAAESLTKQFRKHTVDRHYLALTRGTPKSGRIESVLVRDRGDGRRGTTFKTNPADGKRAVTHVKVTNELGAFAVVECRLETGRTHQVRIHLGEAGTPLCGERLYDRPVNGRPAPDGSGAERPMLHAARLGFTHPETGELMTWDVKPPDDFAALWVRMRAEAAQG